MVFIKKINDVYEILYNDNNCILTNCIVFVELKNIYYKYLYYYLKNYICIINEIKTIYILKKIKKNFLIKIKLNK